MNIQIFPGFNAHYYSYYLFGFSQEFGRQAISYSVADWPNFHQHALAAKVRANGVEKKIYISAGDGPGLNTEALEWCDIYAKINIEPQNLGLPQYGKLFPIGPSFGIRYMSLASTLVTGLRLYLLAWKSIKQPREYFANYYRQWHYRLPLEDYFPVPSQPDYLFFTGTIWRKEQYVNNLRAKLIDIGRSIPAIQFEGGFAPGKEDVFLSQDDLIASRKYPLKEYITKLQRSVVAFNTPAAQHCLGWKLAEFLGLGKAIISTPLTRVMPAPLEHGRHVHYVTDDPDDIRAALIKISQDSTYRQHLEQGAREYFMTYLHPQSVIRRIFKHTGLLN